MKTTFFNQVASLNLKGNLRLNIQCNTEGQMIVSLLLSNKDVKDPAVKKIPPLVLNGTADELDNGFFTAINAPTQDMNKLLCNLAAHEKAMVKAKKENGIEKGRQTELNKQKDGQRKKFDEQMKKVEELEKKNRIGEAIGALPKLADFPLYKDEITKKANALKGKHGGFTLFEQPEPECDSNDSLGEEEGMEEEEMPEEEEQEEEKEEV